MADENLSYRAEKPVVTGAWLRDKNTDEVFYSASPHRYLDNKHYELLTNPGNVVVSNV